MFGWLRAKRQAGDAPLPFGHLLPGRAYRVVRAFADHDGIEHPTGETWTFLRSSFLPYEDGLSLFVCTAQGAERQIRLQRRADAEGRIIDSLHEYVLPAPSGANWTLLLTRDSVCLADDIDAPHAATLDVERDADALAVARVILAASFPAWVGSRATWSFALGPDQVLLGYRQGLRFVRQIGEKPLTARAQDAVRVHLTYWAQTEVSEVLARYAATDHDGG